RRRARRPGWLQCGVERVKGDFELVLSGGLILLGPEPVTDLLAQQPAMAVREQQAKQLRRFLALPRARRDRLATTPDPQLPNSLDARRSPGMVGLGYSVGGARWEPVCEQLLGRRAPAAVAAARQERRHQHHAIAWAKQRRVGQQARVAIPL